MQRDDKGFWRSCEPRPDVVPARTPLVPGAPLVLGLLGLALAGCVTPADPPADELGPAVVEGRIEPAADSDVDRRAAGFGVTDDEPEAAVEAVHPTAGPAPRPAIAPARPAFYEPGGPFLVVPRAEADLLLWRAGSGTLVGLPGARAAERARDRQEALAQLADRLDADSPDREGWLFHLSARLGDSVPEELWCATARTAGALGLYELGERLVTGLEEDASPRRRAGAQAGLHALYGRWFQTPEEAAPFVASITGGPGTELLLESLRREESLATERLLEVLRDDPVRAIERLDDPDPRVRAGVARLLGQAMSTGEVDATALLPELFERAEVEVNSDAYAALLEAALVPLEAAASDSPALARFAAILDARIEMGADELGVPIAQMLARLPWDPSGTVATVGSIGHLLELHLAAEGRRGIQDADAAVSILLALEALCRRLEGTPDEATLRASSAREPVLAIVSDERRDEATRAAAAGALDAFVRPDDDERLLRVLATRPPPALAHALIRPLRSILLASQPGDAHARRITQALTLLAARPDPDLRRRALGVLADEALEPRVATVDTERLLVRLGQEDVPDLSIGLLRLLRRFGTPEQLDELLALPSFPDLARGERATLGALTATLETLAHGDPGATFAAASRLVAVEGADTKVNRTRRALTLIAGLTDEAARDLTPEDNRYIGAWAWRLHAAGVPLEEATPQGLTFVERLVALHLPGSALEVHDTTGSRLFGEAERQHLLAVLLGGLVVAGRTTLAHEEVEAAFQRAEEFAALDDAALVQRIRRDRARFHDRVGDTVAALKEYRGLLANDEAAGVLDNDDLRAAVRLARAVDPSATAPEAFAYLARLVERPSWRDEPGALRVQDLQAVVDAVGLMAEGDAKEGARERVRAYFRDLPAEPVAGGADPPADRPWSGLGRNAEWLAMLRAAAGRLEAP